MGSVTQSTVMRRSGPFFNFNISHDGDWVAAAYSGRHLMGVDVVALDKPTGGSVSYFFSLMRPHLSDVEWTFVNSALTEGAVPAHLIEKQSWFFLYYNSTTRIDSMETCRLASEDGAVFLRPEILDTGHALYGGMRLDELWSLQRFNLLWALKESFSKVQNGTGGRDRGGAGCFSLRSHALCCLNMSNSYCRR